MSINGATLNADQTLVLLSGEKIFSKSSNVRLSLECGGGYPGQLGSYYCDHGDVYLTNKRVVYVTRPALNQFKSLQIPLWNLKEVKVPNQGLPSPGDIKFIFNDGGASEFQTVFQYVLNLLREEQNQSSTSQQAESLPVYSVAPLQDHRVLASSSASASTSAARPPPSYEPTTSTANADSLRAGVSSSVDGGDSSSGGGGGGDGGDDDTTRPPPPAIE